MAVVTIDNIANFTMKSTEMLTFEKVSGIDCATAVVGISIWLKVVVRTSTKNVERPNNTGAPMPIAVNIKTKYIITFDLILCSTNLCWLRFLAV